mmetsp:Transcript_1910/g.4980  ORF Transcript_1910/g.4980 Transcript_1910/m.4980 type:complete len:268 (+) Transcript_1910:1833-2636(+)
MGRQEIERAKEGWLASSSTAHSSSRPIVFIICIASAAACSRRSSSVRLPTWLRCWATFAIMASSSRSPNPSSSSSSCSRAASLNMAPMRLASAASVRADSVAVIEAVSTPVSSASDAVSAPCSSGPCAGGAALTAVTALGFICRPGQACACSACTTRGTPCMSPSHSSSLSRSESVQHTWMASNWLSRHHSCSCGSSVPTGSRSALFRMHSRMLHASRSAASPHARAAVQESGSQASSTRRSASATRASARLASSAQEASDRRASAV